MENENCLATPARTDDAAQAGGDVCTCGTEAGKPADDHDLSCPKTIDDPKYHAMRMSPGHARELVQMLLSTDKQDGATVFDHTPEEIGLHVMENHAAILAALTTQEVEPAATCNAGLQVAAGVKDCLTTPEANLIAMARDAAARYFENDPLDKARKAIAASIRQGGTMDYQDATQIALYAICAERRAVAGDAGAALVEAIIAAIKTDDAKHLTEADYMLDADECIDVIRTVATQAAYPNGAGEELPADVVSLVVAGREAWEQLDSGMMPDEPTVKALDKALERFASRVCYDDEGGDLPDAHAYPCTCGSGLSDDGEAAAKS